VGLKPTDIDVAACKACVDGEHAQGDFKNGILAALGVAAGNPWAALDSTRQREAKVIQYLVVLKRPVKFGSLLFQKEGRLVCPARGIEDPAPPLREPVSRVHRQRQFRHRHAAGGVGGKP